MGSSTNDIDSIYHFNGKRSGTQEKMGEADKSKQIEGGRGNKQTWRLSALRVPGRQMNSEGSGFTLVLNLKWCPWFLKQACYKRKNPTPLRRDGVEGLAPGGQGDRGGVRIIGVCPLLFPMV